MQCLKTPKNLFLKIFGVKRILFLYKGPFFNVAKPGAFNGADVLFIWVSSKACNKSPKHFNVDLENIKDHFLTLLARNPILFNNIFVFFFYFCCTFWIQEDGFFVGLSIIGVIQSNSEVFECRLENSKKPPSFDVLRPKTQFYFLEKCLPFVSTPCAFIRAVVLWVWVSLVWHSKVPKCSSAYLKTPKNPFFWVFLAQKAFFLYKVAFFVSRTPFTLKWAAVMFIWT